MFSIHNNKNKEKPKIQCFYTSHWRVEFLSLNYTCLETFEIHLQIPTPLINGDMKIEKLKVKFGYSPVITIPLFYEVKIICKERI